MRTRVMPLALLVLLATPPASTAFLGFGDTAVVLDPTNLVQNALNAANTAVSNVNELQQIANQVQQITQEAKHLVALPVSLVDEFSSIYQQYTNVLNQGLGITYSYKNAYNQFEQLYATGFNGNVPMMQRAQQMIGQIRAASQSLNSVSAIYERLCQQQSHVKTLIANSQAAPGSLAAQQASNQLIQVLAEQQGSLQEIAATSSRVQMGFIMREVTAEERAQWQAQQWLKDFPQPSDFRGPKQGNGMKLPN